MDHCEGVQIGGMEMKHIKRNIFRKSKRTMSGILLVKRACKLEVDSRTPTFGFCKIGKINYAVELKNGKWVINSSLTKAISKNIRMYGRD